MMHAKENTFYDIYILHSEHERLNREELDKLPTFYSNCSITYRSVGNIFDGAFEIRGITTTAYYRLLIPELVPEYGKVMYSDVDVVFREDMSQYFNVDLTGYYMAGVDNASALRQDVQRYIKDELGIDHKYGHFYSGNLVINSSLILKDNIIPRFRELAKKNFHQQDMDIINIACYGKIKALSPAFCLTNFLTEIIVKRKDEFLAYFSEDELHHALNKGIVHYNGPKPWKEWCVNFDIWWEAYRNSPVYDEQFYFDFFNGKQGELDKLPLLKRVKILLRYFIYGRKK
jgi:lipopolysaccharide biosynthesis glycosyltransferase